MPLSAAGAGGQKIAIYDANMILSNASEDKFTGIVELYNPDSIVSISPDTEGFIFNNTALYKVEVAYQVDVKFQEDPGVVPPVPDVLARTFREFNMQLFDDQLRTTLLAPLTPNEKSRNAISYLEELVYSFDGGVFMAITFSRPPTYYNYFEASIDNAMYPLLTFTNPDLIAVTVTSANVSIIVTLIE